MARDMLTDDAMPRVTELRRRATELAYEGKHKRAAQLYEQILEITPADPQVALRLGEIRRRMGDLPGALVCYERAASLFKTVGLDGKATAAGRLCEELSHEIED